MTNSTAPKSLITKLADVMAAVERVPKRGRNDFHKYDYATEADIAATIRKELAARHVMLIPSVENATREPVGEKGSVLTTLTMTFTFLDGDTGEQLTRAWLGAGTDKEDKGAYKAMTGGEKYFLLKTFLMPTGDDPERDDRERKQLVVKAPKDVQRAPLPEGCAYIISSNVQQWGGEVTVLDSNGVETAYKTTDRRCAERAEYIAQENPAVPVKLTLETITRGKNTGKVKLVGFAPPLQTDINTELDAEIARREAGDLPL